MSAIVVPDDVNDDTGSQLPQNLLFYVKGKKIEKANKLIDQGVGVTYTDEVGCAVLHYAAGGGYVDLVVKLIEKGANINQADTNGETAIHKAARRLKTEVIVALVAYGGDINILNNGGRGALELAVINKDVNLVSLLCKFGAEACLQDWLWTMGDINMLAHEDRAMLDLLLEQSSRYPGYQYGGISFKLLHIKTDAENIAPSLGIKVETEGIWNNFYLFCCKMKQQYTDINNQLDEKEVLFSDVYELMTWGKIPKELKLELTVPGAPRRNERLSLLPIQCSVAGVIDVKNTPDVSEQEDDVAVFTTVSLTLTLRPNKHILFAIATSEKPETFTITEEAVCIQPEMEPEAEIDIPKGTFEGTQSQLFVNVSETKALNTEDTEAEEPILITNVLDLTMSDGKQPQKVIKMKMPIHSDTNSDIIILTCRKEYPEEDEDWEIEDGSMIQGKMVEFRIDHFSMFLAGSKKYKDKAAKLAIQAVKKERAVELFAMIKYESAKTFSLVFECVLKRKGKKHRKQWKEKGFQTQPIEYYSCVVPVYQSFRITFSEGIHVQGADDKDKTIDFHPNRKKNMITFRISDCKVPSGEIEIEKILKNEGRIPGKQEKEPVPKVSNESGFFGCLSSKSVKVDPSDRPQLPDVEHIYQFLTTLSINMKIPEHTVPEEFKESKIDPNDLDCPIKLTVLRWSSLKKLGQGLTDDECYRLGVQLHVPIDSLIELQKQDNFKEKMFEKWRPKRPYDSLVESLKRGLERIDKHAEADLVQEAYVNEAEFKYKMDNM